MEKIRPNIKVLAKFSNCIRQCNSVKDFYKVMFKEGNSPELKGAFGENFFDQYCLEYEKESGFTDFRPATEQEDTENGTDAVGLTYNKLGPNNTQAKAYRQDKAFSDGTLKVKHIGSFSSFKSLRENYDAVFIVCTTLRKKDISQIILKTFSPEQNGWIICRDNFEATIDNDDRFFERFADRIDAECAKIKQVKKRKPKKFELKDFQEDAVAHAAKHNKSFICLPPGSGKTLIQSEVATQFFNTHNLLVYVAPTLALLDQNSYKIIDYCFAKGVDITPTFACSIKDASVTDINNDGFLEKSDVICSSANSIEIQNAIANSNTAPVLLFTTYDSYPKIVKTCKKLGKTFDRIADEALEVVPARELKGHVETAEDKGKHLSQWEVFADNSVINRSVCFDAFQSERKSSFIENEGGIAPGTDNPDVFGKKFFLSFNSMKERGTIVPLKIRIVKVNGSDVLNTKNYHQEGWTKDDVFNFTAFCHTIDHVIQDEDIKHNKIVAFMHRADICPDFVEPIKQYVSDRIKTIEALISDETKNQGDRNDILKRYRAAKNAIIMNYGILGKGIDDDTTTVAFTARNMGHPYGMHGVHRPCRTLAEEFDLKEKKIKPCGYLYVVVDEDDLSSREQYKDLRNILFALYEQTGEWATDIEVVKLLESNKSEDDDIEKTEKQFEQTPIEFLEELNVYIEEQKEDFIRRANRAPSGKSILLEKMLSRDPSVTNYLGVKS